jgi:DNA polymerase III subunit gamma/tau
MSQTLYRKYRPQTFANVLGQQLIVKTITNSILHNRIGQAYLFTGPRGTGKTTMARLLAKAATCTNRNGAEPCLTCSHCLAVAENNSLDIIEIDAASNTGVDNIRELRDSIKLLPTLSTMKVYIIDEVHMLSIGAFNALLKTLEEPPAHVMFILATTSLHKVPDTIVSRCQKFDFTRLPVESIIQKLSGIAQDEQVQITPGAIHMIALAAEGGMRDAESLLMQIIHSGLRTTSLHNWVFPINKTSSNSCSLCLKKIQLPLSHLSTMLCAMVLILMSTQTRSSQHYGMYF